VNHHQVEHLSPRKHLHCAQANLAAEGLVRAQQELLARLAASVESAGNLGTSKRTVGQQAAVLPREGHALGHALVDDVSADLREAIHVGLARAEIAALQCVIKEPINAVAAVLIIFGAVESPMGRDALI